MEILLRPGRHPGSKPRHPHIVKPPGHGRRHRRGFSTGFVSMFSEAITGWATELDIRRQIKRIKP